MDAAHTVLDLRGDFPRRVTELTPAPPAPAAVVLELRPPPEAPPARPPERFPSRAAGFSIRRGEPLIETLRRVSGEQFDAALTGLEEDAGDEGIHLVRTSLKRVRAVLRLAVGTIGEKKRRAESRLLATASRQLSTAREAAVISNTLDKVRSDYQHLLVPSAFAAVLTRLQARYRSEMDSLGSGRASVTEILHDCRTRYSTWEAPQGGFGLLAPGLSEVYRLGRQLGRTATAGGAPGDFHQWRKRVKDLRYAMELLQPVWPGMVGEIREQLDGLGDLLGEHHDLWLLEEELGRRPDLCPDPAERTLLLALGRLRMSQLEQKSLRSGMLLYAEPVRSFVNRLGSYWRVWHR